MAIIMASAQYVDRWVETLTKQGYRVERLNANYARAYPLEGRSLPNQTSQEKAE